MKIRNFFVSNSSSSSFVVSFNTIPRTREQLQEILFKDKESYADPWDPVFWPVKDVTNIVFKDLAEQLPLTWQEVINYAEGTDKVDDLVNDKDYEITDKNGNKTTDWTRKDIAMKIASEEIAREFINENSKSFFYYFTYSDNDGKLSAAMEHGDLFKNVPYLYINNH